MQNKSTLKLIISGVFAALACVATLIHIPTATGYIHAGDAVVVLCGILLGAMYGPACAGIGSMLADLLLGYAAYAPATLIIKATVAFIAAIAFKSFTKLKMKPILALILSAVLGGIAMVSGYLFFEGAIMGAGFGAISAVPGNLLQATAGVVISALLYPVIIKIPQIKDMKGQ